MASRLEPGPLRRSESLQQLSDRTFDLLVVGGGITGAGVALDAATRGLEVALIDKGDFSSGTSSKSSKLVHGGLRYLEHRDFGLMREAASERDLLRRIAPNLVTPMGFFWGRWAGGKGKVRVGLFLYDLLAGFQNVKRHRRVEAEEAGRLIPATSRVTDGYLFYDSQTDDSRLVLAILGAARRAGAVVANHSSAVEFLSIGDRAVGCLVQDLRSGQQMEVRAGDVVNATGVWADELRAREDPAAPELLRPSKGIHIVLSSRDLPLECAVLIPTARRRLIFAVPWRSSVIVGTSDAPYEGSLDAPTVDSEEVEEMLAALSNAFERDYTVEDVVGAFAGLRPLLAGADTETTRDLSRRHAIIRGPHGVVTVTGGKLTTFRRMAEEVVDLVTGRQGRYRRSVTRSVRLGIMDPEALERRLRPRAASMGLGPEVCRSLVFSYGDEAGALLDLAEQEELARPLVEGLPYLAAEVAWGARREMAVTLDDLLARRMRLGLEDRRGGVDPLTIALAARELRLNGDEAARQADAYLESLVRERGPVPPPARAGGAMAAG